MRGGARGGPAAGRDCAAPSVNTPVSHRSTLLPSRARAIPPARLGLAVTRDQLAPRGVVVDGDDGVLGDGGHVDELAVVERLDALVVADVEDLSEGRRGRIGSVRRWEERASPACRVASPLAATREPITLMTWSVESAMIWLSRSLTTTPVTAALWPPSTASGFWLNGFPVHTDTRNAQDLPEEQPLLGLGRCSAPAGA